MPRGKLRFRGSHRSSEDSRQITLPLAEYEKLLADLNMLRTFAKAVYKWRQRVTSEKIEEYYEICKSAI